MSKLILEDIFQDFQQIDDYCLAEQVASTSNNPMASQRNISVGHDPVLNADINYESDRYVFSNGVENPSVVKMQLQWKIKEKLRAEGKEDTFVDVSATTPNENQLTQEDMQKRIEKQERNKESARKSREKKKEDCKMLKEKHAELETRNQELRNFVSQMKKRNKVCKSIIDDHKCMISNTVPQQDHGDDHYMETGQQQVYAFDEGVHKVQFLNATDVEYIDSISEFLDDLNLTLRPQQPEQILSLLLESHSQVVTSCTSYETNCNSFKSGYNIAIQENILPHDFSEMTEKATPKVSSGIIGGKMLENKSEIADQNKGRITSEGRGPINISPLSTTVTSNVNCQVVGWPSGKSLTLVSPKGGLSRLNAWATDTDSQNEEKEALAEVNALHPSPEKRPRLE